MKFRYKIGISFPQLSHVGVKKNTKRWTRIPNGEMKIPEMGRFRGGKSFESSQHKGAYSSKRTKRSNSGTIWRLVETEAQTRNREFSAVGWIFRKTYKQVWRKWMSRLLGKSEAESSFSIFFHRKKWPRYEAFRENDLYRFISISMSKGRFISNFIDRYRQKVDLYRILSINIDKKSICIEFYR